MKRSLSLPPFPCQEITCNRRDICLFLVRSGDGFNPLVQIRVPVSYKLRLLKKYRAYRAVSCDLFDRISQKKNTYRGSFSPMFSRVHTLKERLSYKNSGLINITKQLGETVSTKGIISIT